MSQYVVRRLASFIAVLTLVGLCQNVFAADPPTGAALIEAQLEEAEELLAEDKASHDETARKKAAIDEKLAARRAREEQIQEELKKLCQEQETLSPGSLDSCLEKVNN